MSHTASTATDTELLAAHLAGDPYAFETLFHRHRATLHRLAWRHCPHDADDVLQDAMLAAHRHAGRFRHHAAVSSWLHRIVINACVDRQRRDIGRRTVTLDTDPAVGDPTVGVDTAIMVHRALAQLSAGQRAAVVAVDMHGYSITEAAALLGIPAGTVKSRCARGRRRLAPLLRG